jgi:hypothetical protein
VAVEVGPVEPVQQLSAVDRLELVPVQAQVTETRALMAPVAAVAAVKKVALD